MRDLLGLVAVTALCWIGATCSLAEKAGSGGPSNCAQPHREGVSVVDLPGRPFQAVPTVDGCWIFTSLTQSEDEPARVAVLRRSAGIVSLDRVISLETTPLGRPPSGLAPSGMVLTHDGELLIAAAGSRVAFLDVGRILAGRHDAVLGYWQDEVERPNRVYVNVTDDDRFLFVSEERAGTIAVIALTPSRRAKFDPTTLVGRVSTGHATIALTFSRDQRYIFNTVQWMEVDDDWQPVCKPELRTSDDVAPDHAMGAVVVVDVERAISTPDTAVVARVPAGCNPVRLVTSPDGSFAYVTARNSDALLVFDTEKLIHDQAHALVATVPTGRAPVPVAVVDHGRRVVVASSNQFAGGREDEQSLIVLDAANVDEGSLSIIGSISAGAFPREMRVTDDGRALLVTNFRSRTLQIVDVERIDDLVESNVSKSR